MDIPALVLLLVVCDIISTDKRAVSAHLFIRHEKLLHEREKRSSIWSLFRQIQKGAKFVEKIKTPYDEPLLRYTKLGGRKQALLDFKSINPTSVKKLSTGEVTARLTDSYDVTLRTNSHGDTVLIVFGKKGAVRTVRYLKKPGDNVYPLFKDKQ